MKLSLAKTYVLRNFVYKHEFFKALEEKESYKIQNFIVKQDDDGIKAQVIVGKPLPKNEMDYRAYQFYFEIKSLTVFQRSDISLAKYKVYHKNSDIATKYREKVGYNGALDIREFSELPLDVKLLLRKPQK